MYFYTGIIGFLTGVLMRSFFDLSTPFLLFVGIVALALFVVQRIYKKSQFGALAALFLCFVIVGVGRFALFTEEPSDVLNSRAGDSVVLEGVVYQEPELRENGVRLYVAVDQIDITPLSEVSRIVTTAPFGSYRYGDRVEVAGELRIPEPFETETGRIFAYDTFLAKDAIFFTVSQSMVTVESSHNGFWLKEALFGLKHTLLGAVARIVPEPQAALIGGIVFGVEDALGESLLDAFRRSGLIHIVVLSGFNVAIAADWFMRLASRLPERARVGTGAVGIVLFAIMTGASATTVRASIMALLALFARSTASRYSIIRALMVAVVLMVFHNPYTLVFDLSFQLSVLATLGLIFIAPHIEPRLSLLPSWQDIRGLAAATIAAQIAVLPLIAYQIGELSLVGVLANVLVLPVIPLAMWTGFFTGAAGSLLFLLGAPFGAASYALLSYVVAIAEMVAGLPGAALVVPPFPFIVVLVVYAGITWFVVRAYKKQRPASSVGTVEQLLRRGG